MWIPLSEIFSCLHNLPFHGWFFVCTQPMRDRRRYKVTSSLKDWEQTKNQPCIHFDGSKLCRIHDVGRISELSAQRYHVTQTKLTTWGISNHITAIQWGTFKRNIPLCITVISLETNGFSCLFSHKSLMCHFLLLCIVNESSPTYYGKSW